MNKELKLGPSQLLLLKRIENYGREGLTKGQMLNRCWRVVDRLEELGLVDVSHQMGRGPVYYINEAGRSAITHGIIPRSEMTEGTS